MPRFLATGPVAACCGTVVASACQSIEAGGCVRPTTIDGLLARLLRRRVPRLSQPCREGGAAAVTRGSSSQAAESVPPGIAKTTAACGCRPNVASTGVDPPAPRGSVQRVPRLSQPCREGGAVDATRGSRSGSVGRPPSAHHGHPGDRIRTSPSPTSPLRGSVRLRFWRRAST